MRLKEADYFESEPEAQMRRMEEVTKIVVASSPAELAALNERLRAANGVPARDHFLAAVAALESRLADEKTEAESRSAKRAEEDKAAAVTPWTTGELQLLVKAASQLYPVGARNRYENIASFINEHRKPDGEADLGRPKTARDVISKVPPPSADLEPDTEPGGAGKGDRERGGRGGDEGGGEGVHDGRGLQEGGDGDGDGHDDGLPGRHRHPLVRRGAAPARGCTPVPQSQSHHNFPALIVRIVQERPWQGR